MAICDKERKMKIVLEINGHKMTLGAPETSYCTCGWRSDERVFQYGLEIRRQFKLVPIRNAIPTWGWHEDILEQFLLMEHLVGEVPAIEDRSKELERSAWEHAFGEPGKAFLIREGHLWRVIEIIPAPSERERKKLRIEMVGNSQIVQVIETGHSLVYIHREEEV
jgi:hypothetical protein